MSSGVLLCARSTVSGGVGGARVRWRHGWRIKNEEIRRNVKIGNGDGQEDEGYLAAEAGRSLAENPYPFGTIRHDHWRRGKSQEVQRALWLERASAL